MHQRKRLSGVARWAAAAVAVATVSVAVLTLTNLGHPADAAAAKKPQGVAGPAVHHVFVVNLENKGYDETFGPGSPAPYLSQTLRSQGMLLSQYYGTAHNSLANYIAQISGQGPDSQTQGDCQVYSDFVQAGTAPPEQAVGNGCVYPTNVKTVADQLEAKGLTWKGYMEDMGTPCRHPQPNTVDDTQQAEVGDQYAARHNPFVYFKSITSSPS